MCLETEWKEGGRHIDDYLSREGYKMALSYAYSHSLFGINFSIIGPHRPKARRFLNTHVGMETHFEC